MKRKLKSNSGETLVETLFALLVVVLAMTMLAGSIVSAARVNKGAEDLNTAFRMANKDDGKEGSVTVIQSSGADPDFGERRYGVRGLPGSQAIPAVHADIGSKDPVLDAGNGPTE